MDQIDKILKPEIILHPAPPEVKVGYAYYMEPIKGGYQLHRLTIQEDMVLADDKIEDPDGWPETLGYLEVEFTKEHFAE